MTNADYERAVAAYSTGDGAGPMTALYASIRQTPDDGRLWELLGTFAFANQDLALAQFAIEYAGVLVPLFQRSQLVLAQCYDRVGFAKAAATIYRHVTTLGELPVDLMESLASGLGGCGEYELALSVCRQAARRMPDNAAPLLGIVHYLRRLGRPLEIALPSMHRAHQLEPDNVECRIALAWMLHEQGRTSEGARLLESLSWAEFSCIRCLARMHQVLEHAGCSEQANICRDRMAELSNIPSAGLRNYNPRE